MHCVDWFPTISELVGYEPQEDLQWDGISQWSALTTAIPDSTPRNIYIATGNATSLRFGDWKLITRQKGPLELFNIAEDPFETKNLADTEIARVTELTARLNSERIKDNPVMPEDLKGLPH